MARQETIISIFVASPSDVEEERNRLEEVIRDLNTAWARDLGIRLELVRWETHAYPSFGEDPQSVINSQIPQDFDLFIGIMWYHFGTPTARAGSGTIEEFQRAKDRFDRDASSLQIMIYFKDAPAPVPPSKLDYTQIASIAKFRESLGKEGCLYWPFNTTDDFGNLVRLHLTRYVNEWRSRNTTLTNNHLETPPSKNANSLDIQGDDLGILDMMEQFEVDFDTLGEIAERITNATLEIGQKMEARTKETLEFTSGKEATNRKAAKRLIAKAASDMDQFVARMEAELPLFSHHLNSGMNMLTQAATISIELNINDADIEQINSNIFAIQTFIEAILNVKENLNTFQGSVTALPPMTSVLNRSKRKMVTVIQQLIDEFNGADILAHEAITSFASIIKKH
jgi:hypothetical protein